MDLLSYNLGKSAGGGGGGSKAVVKKDVNFYDYDGTLVNSYTKNEFLSLTSMPANPTHNGLTAQGWNWSLNDAKTYVTSYDKLNIGQMYITDDGATRVYIHLEEGRLKPYLGFAIDGTAFVDWGDGSPKTMVSSDSTDIVESTQHTYSQPGDYMISITSDDTIHILGHSTYNSYLLWNKTTSSGSPNKVYQNGVRKVELGNASIDDYAFYNCYLLSTITIPKTIANLGANSFNNCISLKSATIPSGITSVGNALFFNCLSMGNVMIPKGIETINPYMFNNCKSLSGVTIPSSVTSVGSYAFVSCGMLSDMILPNSITSISDHVFDGCNKLLNVTLPNNITSISSNLFYNCNELEKITLPESITNIDINSFNNCFTLSRIIIPKNVATIGNNAFQKCYSMAYYDFSNHTTIPTLGNGSVFTNIPSDGKIIVPDALYDSWKATQYWSNFASNIISKSNWDALQ